MLSLDRLYYRELKVISTELLSAQHWTKLSDHLPILAEFFVES
jgi:endonuclease/exonuclease/phosphatase family metal-dependent hydrolase